MNANTYRNLAEQVLKNKEDILKHFQRDEVLADFGIRIKGQLTTKQELDAIPTENLQYGDAYAVGTQSPFTYYIWTRANNISDVDYWFDFGEISIVGPAGPRGLQGPKGNTGDSSKWYFMSDGEWTYSTTDRKPGDLTLLYPSYDIWYLEDTYIWVYVGNIKGAQGLQGPRGLQGPQGIQGVPGPKGDTGDVGGFINIAAILATEDQLPRPDLIDNLTVAYLVGSTAPYDLYIQVGSTSAQAQWLNAGPLNVATLVTVNGQYQNTWDADTKVDKIPLSQARGTIAYTRDSSGNNTFRGITGNPSNAAGAFPIYNKAQDSNNGILRTADPEGSNDCVNKRYFDANKKSFITLGTYTDYTGNISLYGTPVDYEQYYGHAVQIAAIVKFNNFNTGLDNTAIFQPVVFRLAGKGLPAWTSTSTCITDSGDHISGVLNLATADYRDVDYDPIPSFTYTLSNPGGSDFIDPKITFVMQDLGPMPE